MNSWLSTGWSHAVEYPYGLLSFFIKEPRPILVRLGQISLLVFIEAVANALAVLKDQFSIDNLESIDIHRHQFVARDAVSAITAKDGFIFRGFLVKKTFVLFGSKLI